MASREDIIAIASKLPRVEHSTWIPLVETSLPSSWSMLGGSGTTGT